ncbi:MAG: ParB/RepB/Spo0J family partition protein [Planctomycetes bacterium]|nr:ParB/RepB/Spo0J family partition protein [Planctomycetota bacterium]MBI3833157.1 ParB/RepB/Spo0J family partition protein [Planctomycetota bacterium]
MPTKKRDRSAPAKMQVVPIDHLVPTPDNKRKPISDASVKSLAQSIKSDGLLQPIVVRQHPTQAERFEIRAGERRWRASRLAGLKEVPVVVRKLDNEQALAVTIAENLLRKDLHPLEEAEAIQLAFDREYDLKAIASRLGKSVGYLARRASLTKLSKVWRTEIMKPSADASRLTAAHLELIARLPEATQLALAEGDFWPVFGRGFPTVDELRRVIDGTLRSLGAMPWDPSDETLDPKAGSCTNCPKRSSQTPMLFPEDDSAKNGKAVRNDRCLDPTCFDRKHVELIQRCETKHRAAHPNLRLVEIGVGTLSPAIQEAFGDRIERHYAPKLVKAGNPNGVPVMQVDGPKAGKLVFIEMGEPVTADGNGRTTRPRGADGKVVPLTIAERRARLQKRRDAFVVKHVHEFLRNLTTEKALEIVSPRTQRRINREAGATVFDPVALLTAFGSTKRADYVDGGDAWKEYDSLRQAEPTHEAATALIAVAQVWIKRLNIQGGHTVTAQAEDARRMCQILGVDFLALFTEARRAIPQPKSWAEPAEPDPPPMSAEPIDDDSQTEEQPSPAELETEAVAVAC